MVLLPQADVEAMALFALELGNTLHERSLECALASALSVVAYEEGEECRRMASRTASHRALYLLPLL
jgi:hypothetical protein